MKKFPQSSDRPRRLTDIAGELNVNAAAILKFVRRRGFEPFKPQEGQNKPWYLSAEDAEAFIQRIRDEKNYRIIPDQSVTPTGLSSVYAIEVPAYDGSTRIKIGWSDNTSDRLSTYRTIVPDLRILRIWPCTASWFEQMALKWADQNGQRIGEEVYEFEDTQTALSELDNLFASLGVKAQSSVD